MSPEYMEILELNLKHFGKFTDYRLHLHAGINIISGGNETGKSTLHAFIRAMLYGITKNRSKVGDEYTLRQPWENAGYFAGSMRLLYEDRIYRIDRNFLHRDESVSVVCETDGTQVDDADSALRAFTSQLNESDFDNTIFIRQCHTQTSAQLGGRIRDFFVNSVQTGGMDLSVGGAEEYLKRRKREVTEQRDRMLGDLETRIQENFRRTQYIKGDLEFLQRRSDLRRQVRPADKAIFERIDRSSNLTESEVKGGSLHAEEFQKDSGNAEGGEEYARRTSGGMGGVEGGEEDTYEGEQRAHEFINDEHEPLFAPLKAVIVLLLFVASILAGVCAFVSAYHRLRYVFGVACVLFIGIGSRLLFCIVHPLNESERALKKARRSEFFERYLGFRDSPASPEYREKIRRQKQERDKAADKAKRKDLEKGSEAGKGTQTDTEPYLYRLYAENPNAGRIYAENPNAGRICAENPNAGRICAEDPSQRRKSSEMALWGFEEGERKKRVRDVSEMVKAKDMDSSSNDIGKEDVILARDEGRSEELKEEIRIREEKLNELGEELRGLYEDKASLGFFEQELESIDLASSRIKELAGRIYRERGERFTEEVSVLLAGLTEGRYNSISVDERMRVRVNTPDNLLFVSQVSYGTMDQIYFALRLAAADLLTDGKLTPLLLDEPFAMYDDDRLESALRYLASSGRQVILFTCQKRELEILAKIKGA